MNVTFQVYQQEQDRGFYLLVQASHKPGSKAVWAIVDSLDPDYHRVHLQGDAGGTQSPTELEGPWTFDNGTSMTSGDIFLNCS